MGQRVSHAYLVSHWLETLSHARAGPGVMGSGVRGYFSSFLFQRDEVGGVSTNRRAGGEVAGEKVKSTNRVNGEGSHST
jgi:hypothetical protein